jgi:hypothetical protein
MSFEKKTTEEAKELEEVTQEDFKVREKVIQLAKEEYDQILNEELVKYKHLKNMMEEEREAMQRNSQKVMMNWRKVLSLMKSTELKQQFEIEASLFQRQLDSKDVLIQSLEKRLENCIAQYETALRAHYIHMGKFNGLVHEKITALQEDFNSNLKILHDEFKAEDEEIMQLHLAQVT